MVAKATVAPAQHKDPVSVLKALYLDRERLFDQCYGPLDRYDRQEELWIDYDQAMDQEDYQQATDSLTQYVESTGYQLTAEEKDALLVSLKDDTPWPEPIVTAFRKHAAFGQSEPDEQQINEFWDSPLLALCGMLGEQFECSQIDLDSFAGRLLSNHGIGPMVYYQRPDGTQPDPLPDLRPIVGEVAKLRDSGAFGNMVEELYERYPIALERAGVAPQQPEQPVVDETPSLARGGESSCTDGSQQEVRPSILKAYLSYKRGERDVSDNATDREVYEWLKENDPDWKIDALFGYELPSFQTWGRYVRKGRRLRGEQKNHPRAGRQQSGSSVRRSDI